MILRLTVRGLKSAANVNGPPATAGVLQGVRGSALLGGRLEGPTQTALRAAILSKK